MLEALLGSTNKERVLIFLYARKEGYPREIARFFSTGLTPIQRQLEVLERGRIVVSRLAGRTRLYTFNPAYPLLQEVEALVEKAMRFYPEEERNRLLLARRRPRRKDKPL
jgi:predicted transcriptional regulator